METEYAWEELSDQDLLKLRIRDLKLRLENSDIYPLIQTVEKELRDKGLSIQTRLYIGDEWFSPEDTVAISIPFFLTHPRLRQLERKMMYDCEGEKEADFLKLLRHEFGHVFDHAFKVSRRKKWKKVFGDNTKDYQPEAYRARPYSRNFVHNISDQYAQAHPDEDFAESFAVWLDPKSNWRVFYKNWPALKKVQYVESLSREFSEKKVLPAKGRMIADAKSLSTSLEHYYKRKKKYLKTDLPDFYNADLKKIFLLPEDGRKKSKLASSYLRRQRKFLVTILAPWTKERKIIINQILNKLIFRSRESKLLLPEDEAQMQSALIAYLASLLTRYRMTGRWNPKL
ncbi:MAG: hypothetical protein COV44_03795 [Deltaproteobacteria bacterium CG11_big_fil_rev_8_21_14_0_20_45_16]|nr:MAG: hypothetical protein COV44_03795 [Deltaproteobacteria bacterium CG11_big_fil_rev_8_21_14_0_20_45_16]